jgi:hypothetical protein
LAGFPPGIVFAGPGYKAPRSNLNVVDVGTPIGGDEMERQLAAATEDGQRALEPLRLNIPTAGLRLAFAKLYANQGDEEAWFRVAYSSPWGSTLGTGASLLAALLLWLGGWLWWTAGERHGRLAMILAAAGLALLGGAVVLYGVSPWPAVILSALLASALAALPWARARLAARGEVGG